MPDFIAGVALNVVAFGADMFVGVRRTRNVWMHSETGTRNKNPNVKLLHPISGIFFVLPARFLPPCVATPAGVFYAGVQGPLPAFLYGANRKFEVPRFG